MNRKELDAIMEGDSDFNAYKGKSRVLMGLNLIAKYIPDPEISPDHDIIYAGDADKLVEAGLTKADAIELRKMNWMVDSEFDCLAIFT